MIRTQLNSVYLHGNWAAQGPIKKWAQVKGRNKYAVHNKAIYNIWAMMKIKNSNNNRNWGYNLGGDDDYNNNNNNNKSR
jgi:hypothetical protein